MTNFRLCAKSVHLTYKTHLKVEEIVFKTKKEFFFKAFHETGKTGYLHTHVVCYCPKKFDTKDERFFDINNIHPHIKRIYTKLHWERAVAYDQASKKEGSKYEVIHNNLPSTAWEFKGALREAIQLKNRWADVINDDDLTSSIMNNMKWAREVFNAKPNNCKFNLIEEYGSFLDWQTFILDRVKNQTKRQITWVYDKIGHNGKSDFSEHLEDNENAFTIEGGKANDICYEYEKEELVVFDIPKSKDKEIWKPYNLMERFKKGRIKSYKYLPCKKYLPSDVICKVVVFANYLPDWEEMSKDRWDVWSLHNFQLSRVPYGATSMEVPPGSLNIKNETPEKEERSYEEFEEMLVEANREEDLDLSNEIILSLSENSRGSFSRKDKIIPLEKSISSSKKKKEKKKLSRKIEKIRNFSDFVTPKKKVSNYLLDDYEEWKDNKGFYYTS